MNALFVILAAASSVLGLFATGAAVYMLLLLRGRGQGAADFPRKRLLRWTVADYAAIGLFGCGILYLLADVVAVIRDRELYPFYHYGYLLSGLGLLVLGVVFLLARFALVLHLARSSSGPVAPDHHAEPHHADHAE